MRVLAERVMMGPRHAIVLTVALNAIPLVQFLGIALIALVVLRQGAQGGLMVAGWNLLPLGLWSMFLAGPPISIQLLMFMIIGALVLKETSSWRAVTVVAVIHGIVLTIIIDLFAAEWFRQITEPAVLFQEQLAPEGVTRRQLYVSTLAWIGAFHALMFISLMMLARWWQSALYNPLAFGREMRGLRLSPIFVLGLIVAALLCILVGSPETIVILFVPLLVSGLALIHWLVADRELGAGPLVAIYLVLLVVNQVIIPLVLLLSLLDSSFDLRKKLAAEHND